MDTPTPSSSDSATPPAQDAPAAQVPPVTATSAPTASAPAPNTPLETSNDRAKEEVPFSKTPLAQNLSWTLGVIISLITIGTFAVAVFQDNTNRAAQADPLPTVSHPVATPTRATGGIVAVPTVRPPSGIPGDVPPPDPLDLARWFRQVVDDNVDVGAAQAALVAAGLLVDPADWNTTHDLSGDGRADWVVLTAPTARGCRNLWLINPLPAPTFFILDANGHVSAELRNEIQSIVDISGDGVDDLLYSLSPCAAGRVPTSFTLYTAETVEGNPLGASNRYGYLRLLLANEVMAQGAYHDAVLLYENITFQGGAGVGMGWEYSAAVETGAVRTFAGARLLLADYLADREEGQSPGADDGRYEDYVAEFPDSPYLAPVTFMVNALRAGESPEAACAAFRDAVTDPATLTYPLNEMGVLVLGVAEVCPF